MNHNTKIRKKNANAKINIYLQILNKRLDGFHNLNSLFYPIPLCDEIKITISDKLELCCNKDLGITPEENIIYKATEKLQKCFPNKNIYPKIELIKNIPSGAGLGGGSSDAATTLKLLNEIYELHLSLPQLKEIAEQLGSDVPFFLYDKPAVVTGRGENILPIDFHINYFLLIVFPNIHINTGKAYQLLNRKSDYTPTKIIQISKSDTTDIRNLLQNDFEEFVFKNYPEMNEIKTKLVEFSDKRALMSGSGSSFFAFFDDEKKLENAKIYFDKLNYFTFICKL